MKGLIYARLAKQEIVIRNCSSITVKGEGRQKKQEEKKKAGKQQSHGMLRLYFRQQGPFAWKYF